jgi:hypothetical protein
MTSSCYEGLYSEPCASLQQPLRGQADEVPLGRLSVAVCSSAVCRSGSQPYNRLFTVWEGTLLLLCTIGSRYTVTTQLQIPRRS